jgi:cyclopropane-fatty-acyl-phospholipid synthase
MTTTHLPALVPPVDLAAGLRVALARTLLTLAAKRVPVDVRLPDGRLLVTRRDPCARPVLQLVRPEALLQRIAAHPKVGIGEGYMAGDWRPADGTDLAAVLLPFAERITTVVPPPLARLRRLVDRPIPRAQRNTPSGSRRNIEAHYDLGNELFAAFLDPTMSYSSALFDDARPFAAQDLAEAQLRKVRAVLDLAEVRRGSRVLEIGTGWGTLAIEAAQRGATVTSVTLSHEQARLARERVRAADLGELVTVRVADYRELAGCFDAIVSVEMIEAVGDEYWPTFFTTLDRLLAPGGVVALQAIVMAHERYLATRRSHGWIHKHVFPGGMIPSLHAIRDLARQHTRLRVDLVHSFGRHYAETLRRWRSAFTAASDDLATAGFDETFRRKWEFYLAYSEAGFDSGYLDVAQIRLARPTSGGRG